MNSNKMAYVLAGSAIGGAAALFLLSDAGRRATSRLANMDANTIPNQLEKLRGVIDRTAEGIGGRVESARGRFTGSVDAGRRAYDDTEREYRMKLRRLEER